MKDYKTLCLATMICATLVNTQADSQTARAGSSMRLVRLKPQGEAEASGSGSR